jgi:hypothetical protein
VEYALTFAKNQAAKMEILMSQNIITSVSFAHQVSFFGNQHHLSKGCGR